VSGIALEKGLLSVGGTGAEAGPVAGRTIRLVPPQPDQRFEVDPQFKNLLPPQSAGELAELEREVLTEGCRDPLVVWEQGDRKALADGHTRLEICLRHRRPYQLTKIDLPTREEVLDRRRGIGRFLWNEYGTTWRSHQFRALDPEMPAEMVR
jgi:hypothetical protein